MTGRRAAPLRQGSLAICLGVLALVSGTLPSQAVAASQFGAELDQSPTSSTCAGCTILTEVHANGAAESGAPFSGALTSISLKSGGGARQGQIVILRATGSPGEMGIVAHFPIGYTADPSPGGHITTTDVDVPIAAGDRVGVQFNSAARVMADGSPRRCLRAPLSTTSGTATFSDASCGAREVLVRATIEPDADGDGHGGETRDRCDSDPTTTTTACSADVLVTGAPSSAQVLAGDRLEYAMTAANDSSTVTSDNVVLRFAPSPLLIVRTATASSGTCRVPNPSDAGASVSCSIGKLGPKAKVTVKIEVRAPTRPGLVSSFAAVSASTVDPMAANNAFRLNTEVVPLPGNCANVFIVTTLAGGRLTGTEAGDLLRGDRGADTLRGLGGNDCLEGGSGDDRLFGNAGRDKLRGGRGADRLRGGTGNDRLSGGSGNDRLDGGSGSNRYFAGSGNDVVRSANGRRERVDCGKGVDRIQADTGDRLAACEHVTRVP